MQFQRCRRGAEMHMHRKVTLLRQRHKNARTHRAAPPSPKFRLFNGVFIPRGFATYFRREFTGGRRSHVKCIVQKEREFIREGGLIVASPSPLSPCARATKTAKPPSLRHSEHSRCGARTRRGMISARFTDFAVRHHRAAAITLGARVAVRCAPLSCATATAIATFRIITCPVLDPECSRHVRSLRSGHVRPTTTTTTAGGGDCARDRRWRIFRTPPSLPPPPSLSPGANEFSAPRPAVNTGSSSGIPDLNSDDRFFEFVWGNETERLPYFSNTPRATFITTLRRENRYAKCRGGNIPLRADVQLCSMPGASQTYLRA